MHKKALNLVSQILKYPNYRLLSTQAVANEKLSISNKNLVVDNDGQKFQFPIVWLRDNCQCESCFHKLSRSRIIDWRKFNVNPQLKNAEITNENDVKVTWDDDHVSVFQRKWLIERNFTEENRKRYMKEVYRPAKVYWSKEEFTKILKTFEFKDVIETDQALHDWLECLAIYGISILKNTPADTTQIRKLANRIAFIKTTQYGEEFEVKVKGEVYNTAYNNTNLPLHTDLPYYEYKPGLNMLHCLVQSKKPGGDNLIADSFYGAKKLEEKYPEYYKILSETLVNWNDIGKDSDRVFHSLYRAPVICKDREGELARVNFSIAQRDSSFIVPIDIVQQWYEAMDTFSDILYEEAVKFKTSEGDILIFDNLRMVHGRTAYEENSSNTRHLVGAYLDWDEAYSKLRVLKFGLDG